MEDNPFFHRNTIKSIADFSESTYVPFKVRSKRAKSVVQLTNMSKFHHRQVFNSKIYQKVNFFELGLTQLRNQKKQSKITSLNKLHQVILNLSEHGEDKCITNFTQQYANHWKLVQRDIKNQVVESFTNIITQLLKKLLEKFQVLQKANNIQKEQLQRLKTDLKIIKKTTTITQIPLIKQTKNIVNKQKLYRQKNMVLDFQIKKEMLRSQKLEEKLKQQGKKLQQLGQSNNKLLKEKEEQKNERQAMEYKVNRLKEELQVAHIVKEQNLADKMKYIMNW